MNQKCQIIISGSLAAIAILSGAILASNNIYADDVVDQINITVPVSCSLSGTGMNTHNAEINNGQYNSAIGETTIKAFCNDNNGFAIYAIGYTDDTDGKNVLTSSTLGSTYDIATGTATSGNTSNWAMKLSTVSSPIPTYPITIQNSFDSFHNVPDDYTLVAKRTSGTDIGTNAEGSTLTTTYQAYISKTQPAGTYTGQVKYTLVHPHNATKPSIPVSIEDITYMQDLASLSTDQIASLKNSMTEDAQYQMTDSRDNKTYYVAKLKDGNIWMTQNLDLDLESTPTNVAPLTSGNTDLPANTTWTPLSSTRITSDTTWTGSATAPESYDPGDKYWNEIINVSWQNPSEDYMSTTGNPHYHLGNYYNWTAAVAMNDSSAYDTAGELANQSICPAGWTLPRGGTGEDTFKALWDEYGFTTSSINGDNKLWTTPLYFNPAGNIFPTLSSVGNSGNIWTAVVSGSNPASYWSYFTTSGSIMPNYTPITRFVGNSIRCLARPVTNTIEGL